MPQRLPIPTSLAFESVALGARFRDRLMDGGTLVLRDDAPREVITGFAAQRHRVHQAPQRFANRAPSTDERARALPGDERIPEAIGTLTHGVTTRRCCWRSTLRRMGVASFVSLMLVAPSQGSAQALQSFEDLALRVNLDDQLQVEDQSGVKAAGRLTRLTRDDIAIQTEAGEKHFTSETVRAVSVRGHALGRGALIGAVVFAILGAAATCSHEDRENCVIVGTFRAAPIGAGVGLAIGALTPRKRAVYREPENRAFLPPSGGVIGVQPSLLEDLALRVNLDDRLLVEDASGGRTTGRLTRLTAGEITLQTAAGEKHFTRETVRQIGVRRQPLRLAVLIGAGAGAATGAVAACTGPEHEECADAPIIAGGIGAGLGLAVGALIHKTTIVYPELEKRMFIVPAISRGAVGVTVSRRW
jgi:hypothetical protein